MLVISKRYLFVRTLGLLFAMAFFTAQGARQGDTVLAANAVLLQFIMLTSYALDGFAHAAESLVGRAYGRRDWREFAATVRATAQFSFWTSAAAAKCVVHVLFSSRTLCSVDVPFIFYAKI